MHSRGLPRVRVQGEQGLCADMITETIRSRRKKYQQQSPKPNTSDKIKRLYEFLAAPRRKSLTGATTEAGNRKEILLPAWCDGRWWFMKRCRLFAHQIFTQASFFQKAPGCKTHACCPCASLQRRGCMAGCCRTSIQLRLQR